MTGFSPGEIERPNIVGGRGLGGVLWSHGYHIKDNAERAEVVLSAVKAFLYR